MEDIKEIDDEAAGDSALGENQISEADEQPILISTDSPNSRPFVFLSYRHNPDEPLAAALKRLLETTIDPAPYIFVAGDGGLRPSEIGYKPQLQKAVQQARAFLGLISPAAIDREWLYYEAGAAWGRGQLYAPILAGTTASDLSSVIADYQATRASNRDEMRRLVERIAETVNAVVRKSFARSFTVFERALNQHLTPSSPSQRGVGDVKKADNVLAVAHSLMIAGKSAEAEELYKKLEDEAEGLEGKADARISYILAGKESGLELIDKLEQINDSYKTTAGYNLWMGIFDSDTEAAMRRLKIASVHSDASVFTRRTALIQLARRTHQSGYPLDALAALLGYLRSADRLLRSNAAELWINLRRSDKPMIRFLVAIYGNRFNQSNDLLKELANLSLGEHWSVLTVHYAEFYDEIMRTGTSANDLGRAYSDVGFHSLAFRAYNRSADAGVGVAKCNMAQLLLNAVVPAAGLSIMQQHSGAFDAMSPEYPHQVRAELEARVNNEKLRAMTMSETGEQLARLLGDVAAQGFSCTSPDAPISGVVFSDGQKSFRVVDMLDGFALHDEDGRAVYLFRRLMSGLPFWSLVIDVVTKGVCATSPEGGILVLAFDFLNSESSGISVTRYRQQALIGGSPQPLQEQS